MKMLLDELRKLALRHCTGKRIETAIAGVAISKADSVSGPVPGLYEPMLCLVLQGAKSVIIGDRTLNYDAASYFVTSVQVPSTGRVVEATPDRPFVALYLAIDAASIANLVLDIPVAPEPPLDIGFAVSPVTAELLDSWLRLLKLLDAPQDLAVLAPLYKREILYRLLQGPRGPMLRQIAKPDSRLSQIRRAMAWIRENYDKPLPIEATAGRVGMSASSFHRHFKAVTAMSPLQFQKMIRRQQARELLMANAGDATRISYTVGYESASQFSREYARLFGAPPGRDLLRLRADRTAYGENRDVA